jgi:hypothetical protein
MGEVGRRFFGGSKEGYVLQVLGKAGWLCGLMRVVRHHEVLENSMVGVCGCGAVECGVAFSSQGGFVGMRRLLLQYQPSHAKFTSLASAYCYCHNTALRDESL